MLGRDEDVGGLVQARHLERPHDLAKLRVVQSARISFSLSGAAAATLNAKQRSEQCRHQLHEGESSTWCRI